MSVRRLLKVMAGMVIGAIGLIAWAGTSSAESAPPPPPPGVVADLLGQVLPPVQQTLDPIAPGLLPAVDGLVTPVVETVDPALSGLAPIVNPVVDGVVTPVLEALDPVLPGLPGLPGVPGLPGPDQPQIPALPLPGLGPSPLDPVGAGPVTQTGGAENAATAPAGQFSSAHAALVAKGLAPGSDDRSATIGSSASSDGSSSTAPFSPLGLPIALVGLGGTILSSAASGSGLIELALIAVLSGAAALAAAAAWRRLARAGLLTPRAMSYAIATPPG